MSTEYKGYENWDHIETVGSLTTLENPSTLERRTVPTGRLKSGVSAGSRHEGPSVRNTVLGTLGVTDMTCDELEVTHSLPHQTVSATLTGLKKEGRVKVVGKRMTRTGSLAGVYHAV